VSPLYEWRSHDTPVGRLAFSSHLQYRATLVDVGTSPSGKDNYAPVVRYIDNAEAAAIKAESKTKGRQLSKNAKRLVELFIRIETRDGRKEVPRNVLADSGYLAHVSKQGWDSKVVVCGIQLSSLQNMVYAEDAEVGQSADGQRRVPDRSRKRWERSRNSLKTSGAGWIYDGWVWLAEEDASNDSGR